MRLAIAGLGNNASALLQGIEAHRSGCPIESIGVARPILHGISLGDIECVLGFEANQDKIGLSVEEAIFGEPNNFPTYVTDWTHSGRAVAGIQEGRRGVRDRELVAEALGAAQVDVLLLSLPTGQESVCHQYARAALDAGAAVVNCSADRVARSDDLMSAFVAKGVPLIGDDLASQFGSSLIHRALLDLLDKRGLTLDGSYQINIGGNEDFRNLREHGANKLESKLNVLGNRPGLTVVPSGGYIPYLQDHKVAHIRIDGRGWLNSPVSIDVRLHVQDSSNAAGVIVDLIRIAAHYRTRLIGGCPEEADRLLKSSPHPSEDEQDTTKVRRGNVGEV